MPMLLLQKLCFSLSLWGQTVLLDLGPKAKVVEAGVAAKDEAVLAPEVLVDRVFVSWWGCGPPFQQLFCPFKGGISSGPAATLTADCSAEHSSPRTRFGFCRSRNVYIYVRPWAHFYSPNTFGVDGRLLFWQQQ